MLMSFRKAEIAFSAADSSLKVSSVPMTIRRCFLVCPESLQTMAFGLATSDLVPCRPLKILIDLASPAEFELAFTDHVEIR
jgi:hypothetical protein